MEKENHKSFRMSEDKNANWIGAIIFILVFGGVMWFIFLGNDSPTTTQEYRQQPQIDPDTIIYTKVAEDEIELYGIALKGKDFPELCYRAGVISTAWLQAKNEKRYLEWKEIEKAMCGR